MHWRRGSLDCIRSPTIRGSPARCVIICSGRSHRERDYTVSTKIPRSPASRLRRSSSPRAAPASRSPITRPGARCGTQHRCRYLFRHDRGPPASIVGTVPPHHMYGFETTVCCRCTLPASAWCGAAFYPEDVASRPARRARAAHTGHHAPAAPRHAASLGPVAAARAHRLCHGAAVPRYGCAAESVGTRGCSRFSAPPRSARSRAGARSRAMSGPPIPASVISHDTLAGEPVDALVSGPFADPYEFGDMVEMLDAHHFRLLGRRPT